MDSHNYDGVNDDELAEMICKARSRIAASRVGSMHPMWDLIAEGDAHLAGNPHTLSRDETVRLIEQFTSI